MDADELVSFRDLQLGGTDMHIDGYEQYNQQENEVVDISPGDHSEDAAETPLRADNRKFQVYTRMLENLRILMPVR